MSRRLVKVADRPVILAGGLTPENVKRAILEVHPAGIDSHTGVEDSTRRKNRKKSPKVPLRSERSLRPRQSTAVIINTHYQSYA